MTSNPSTPVALITGASRGLGRSIARHLAAQGVDIIGTYHSNKGEADAVQGELTALGQRVHFIQLDVEHASTFAAFIQRVRDQLAAWKVDRLSYVVQNAGIGVHAPIAETTAAQFDRLYAIHLKAPALLTQLLLPALGEGSKVLNVSTGLARFTFPGYGAYAAMKGGVEVLTRYQAKEFGPMGITVNTLAPGAIATDFGGGLVRDNEQVNQQVSAGIALGRVGEPEDVGAAAAGLLLASGSWINGQRIEVSGGQML